VDSNPALKISAFSWWKTSIFCVRIRDIVAGEMYIPIFSRNSWIFGSETLEACLRDIIRDFTP